MNLIKSTSIYTISSVLNAVIPFLLLPILTSYLTTEEYGVLSLFTVVVSFVFPIITLGVMGLISIEFFKLEANKFKEFLNSILFIPVFMFLVITVIAYFFTETFSNLLNINQKWIVLIPLFALVQIIPTIVQNILQIKEKPYFFAILQIARTLLNVSLSIYFVVYLNYNWEGRIVAIFLSFLVFTIIGLFILYKLDLLRLSFNSFYIRDAIKHGSPLIVHSLAAIIFAMSDRFFISAMLGNSSVGLYAVGYQVSMIASFFGTSFNSAWVPYLFKNLKLNTFDTDVKIVKISYLMFFIYLSIPFLLYVASKYIIFEYFIDLKFHSALQFVFIIALGYSFLNMYKMVTNYLFYEKNTKLLSSFTLLSALMNLALNYVFIDKFGAVGAAYSTCITLFIFFIAMFFVANRIHSMPWLFFRRKELY